MTEHKHEFDWHGKIGNRTLKCYMCNISPFDYIAILEAEKAALQGFKDYVHQRLNEAGIPTHPEGPHSAAGCRIGDRLDIALEANSD